MKSDFQLVSFKGKFIQIFFVHNLMIGCPKRIRGNCPEKALEQRNKEPGLKFNHGLALIGL